MNARKLLEQVVRANAHWLVAQDPGARRAAMDCILAQADDYAARVRVLPAEKPVTPESERLRARRLNGDRPSVTAVRRETLRKAVTR